MKTKSDLARSLQRLGIDPQKMAKFIEESVDVELHVLWTFNHPDPHRCAWYPERKETMIQAKVLAQFLHTLK
jgi:hypothetical protein